MSKKSQTTETTTKKPRKRQSVKRAVSKAVLRTLIARFANDLVDMIGDSIEKE